MDNHMRARFAACRSVLAETLKSIERTPADSFLAALFRKEHKYGSSDRRFIRDSVFAVLRQALWLEKAGIPLDSERALECAVEAECSPEKFCKLTGAEVSFADSLPAFAGISPRDAEWFMKKASLWIRANDDSLNLPGFERHPAVRNAFRAEESMPNLRNSPEYRAGKFEIQDLSSQCIGLAAAPKPGESWCDFCAGAGGKSLQLAQLMNHSGSVTASDVRDYLFDEIAERAARAGSKDVIRTVQKSALAGMTFDGVLVDAPCSSSGRFRRNPELRLTLAPEKIAALSRLQLEILREASALVKPGGVLVYATCSLIESEDGGIVRSFLAGNPEFSPEPFPHPLFNQQQTDGLLRIHPYDADCDASFAARFRRTVSPARPK